MYHQLAQALLSAIDSGELASGDILEQPTALARRLRIATNTVRRAYAALLRDGNVRQSGINSAPIVDRTT
ncbi:hypothetical protein CH267_06810 [Rhodococcus sp. 06-621-2]|nr:hypothetical protein CH267_06810 [Rhodococcus sp. 06-621-2]